MVVVHRPAAAVAAILLVLAVAVPARASAGDLDPSFGVDGATLVVFPEGFDTYIMDMAVQTDGKIVVVGDLHESLSFPPLPPLPPTSLKSSGEGLVIVRFTADGEPDPSFGEGGGVSLEGSESAFDVAIDDLGRIVVSGTILAADSSQTISVARLLQDGSLDPSFGSGGRVTTPPTQNMVNALVIQPDGKIVAAERSGNRAVLRRYEADGTVDSTFGFGGRVSVPHVPDGFTDVELQPDGRLVAVGGLDPTLLIARFNVDGSLDPTFAGDGMRRTGFKHFQDAFPIIVGIDGSGRVVVMLAEVFVSGFGLAVYTSNGKLDRTFRGGGTATVLLPRSFGATGGTLQADGKIVVTSADFLPGGDFALGFGLHRFLPTGRLDPSFGRNGHVITDFGTDDMPCCISAQVDGRLVVAGVTWLSDGSSGLRVARYLSA